MTRGWMIALLALGACAIDDRKVKVSGACVVPPAGGLITDFSAARRGVCPAGICSADLVGKPTVSLGVADVMGLIFPYSAPGPSFIALDVVSTLSPGDAASGQALQAAVDSRPPQTDASTVHEGFALYLIDCIDASAYAGVTFTANGDLASCPLRFAVQFKGADGGTSVTADVPVMAGTTTLDFTDKRGAGGATELAGMHWELDLSSAQPGRCVANFTLDDITLVSRL